MAIIQRLINVQFTGAPNLFLPNPSAAAAGGSGASASISGLRTSVNIKVTGMDSMASANCRIYGMSQDLMNAYSTLGMAVIDIQNRSAITIQAGDLVNGMYTIYQGTVTNAWADYQALPNVPFNVESASGLDPATRSIPPTSVNSASADVAGTIQQIASQAGLSFTNNGVNVKVAYPYLWGSPRDQILALVRATGIQWSIEQNTVSIWPKNSSRDSTSVTLSPGQGLIGYPSFINQGLMIRTLFNPQIRFGTTVVIQGSSVTPANGTWIVQQLEHKLESLTPNGAWFTNLALYNLKYAGNAPVLSAGL